MDEFYIGEPNYIELISNILSLKSVQVKNTLKLFDDKNTVPFIARYRKEMTGNLDESVIREILDLKDKEEKLYSAKYLALKNIDELGKLTEQLKYNIINSKTLKEVEDLYAPYKKKKKTKAMIAIEKGFQPVAQMILNQEKIVIPKNLLDEYDEDEIILGAKDIVSQEIADNVINRDLIRIYYKEFGEIVSEYKKSFENLDDKIKSQIYKFEIYGNFSVSVSKIKSYQTLALNRGEDLGILNVKLKNDVSALELLEEEIVIKDVNKEELIQCVKEGYKKIFTSIETEIRNLLTQKAHEDSIKVFQKNLKELLLIKPMYGYTILAIDPGFRTGCKVAVIDENMKPIEFSKFFLDRGSDAKDIVSSLIKKYSIDYIVIGNGTGSDKTYELLKDLGVDIAIVNESGASVYSASSLAKEEFPDLDLTDRGTISIGRRFIDPLSELVKIPVESIGVGMYQHDINQNELKKKLSYVVEDVVNSVGVNVNTASIYVLKEISGLDLKSAKKISNNRPYKSRKDIKKVLSDKAYEQSIGFLMVPESLDPLDSTFIHPEQYEVAKYIFENNIKDYEQNESILKNIYANINLETFNDIIFYYNNKDLDIRKNSAILKKVDDVEISFESIGLGDILDGVVRNITQFGAFVDVGLKNDGLVHISQITDSFVKDPSDFLQVGESVKVKVIKIDSENYKLGLSMRDI